MRTCPGFLAAMLLSFVVLGVVVGESPAPTTQPASAPASKPGLPLPPNFLKKSLKQDNGKWRNYIVYLPPAYKADDARKWPILIFLHGSGERGEYAPAAITVGLGPYIARKRINDFPFITVFPQANEMWWRGAQEEWVWKTLAAVQKEYRTDPDRVYLTGISMGGFGAWDLAIHHPDRLAAIVPICGGCEDLTLLCNLRGMPVHAFHGQQDQNVPIVRSRQIIQMIKDYRPRPKYTEYRELAHNCWDRAFDDPKLYDWLLEQKRRSKLPQFTVRYPAKTQPLPWRVWWLEVNEVETSERPPTVSLTIDGDNIIISSEAVKMVTFYKDEMPVESGKEITITWNGQLAYRGPLSQDLRIPMP